MKWLLRAVWEVSPISWLDRATVDASAARAGRRCSGALSWPPLHRV